MVQIPNPNGYQLCYCFVVIYSYFLLSIHSMIANNSLIYLILNLSLSS